MPAGGPNQFVANVKIVDAAQRDLCPDTLHWVGANCPTKSDMTDQADKNPAQAYGTVRMTLLAPIPQGKPPRVTYIGNCENAHASKNGLNVMRVHPAGSGETAMAGKLELFKNERGRQQRGLKGVVGRRSRSAAPHRGHGCGGGF